MCICIWASQVALVVKNLSAKKKKKNLSANAGCIRYAGLIHGWGRSPGGGNDNLLQYSCPDWKIPLTEEPGGLQSMGLQSQT